MSHAITPEFLVTLRGYDGDHEFISDCLDGALGTVVQDYAEDAIADTPDADIGENDCRAIANRIIHAAYTNQDTQP